MTRKYFVPSVVAALVVAAGAAASPAHAARASKVGPLLRGALRAYELAGADAAHELFRARGLRLRHEGKMTLVPLVVTPEAGTTAAQLDALLARLGGRVDARSRSFVRVLVPMQAAAALVEAGGFSAVREPIAAKPLALGKGPALSEAVTLTGADALQDDGVLGAGVKVAVVDLGFTGLTAAINNGNLPTGTVRVDLSGTGLETDTEHGTGVAEHVLDMAPGVTLYCIKVGDEVDLQNAADYVATNGIHIANHSVGWVNSSYYDDTGPINAIINESYDVDGVFWAVAAGNDAEMHWRGAWKDTNGNKRLEFSGTDELLDLTTASTRVNLFLNWNQYGNSLTDLDLYVYDKNNTLVATSDGPQTGAQEPSEAVAFNYSSTRAPYRVRVVLYSGPSTGLDVTLFSFYNDLEYAVAASSLTDPAPAHGSFTVGAIDYRDWNLAAPPPESFSSQGPTNDGRLKPDIAAPDGTTSYTYGVGGAFGTSFASPTTAGAAALLKSQDPTRTAAQLRAALVASAQDLGAAGADNVFGAGKLHVAPPGPPNEPPVAVAGSASTAEDTPVTVTLAATDAEGATLTFAIVAGPAHGTLSTSGPSVTYTPSANYAGADSFTFVASDGAASSNVATFSLTVTAVNDAPVAAPQSVSTPEDTARTVTVSATDVDSAGLTYTIVTPPASGTLSGSGPAFTYTPAANFNGVDGFSFAASDGALSSNTATVTLTVTAVNDPPQAAPQSVTSVEDTPQPVTLTATDIDSGALTFAIVVGPAHGTLAGAPPSLTYTPAANYAGPDSFTFRAFDGAANSNVATVSVLVSPVDDPPVALAQFVAAVEDTAGAVTLGATDVNSTGLTFVVEDEPAFGALTGTPPALTYLPGADFAGTDTFTFRVFDATSASAAATVTIDVAAVNDPPVAADGSAFTDEDTALGLVLAATDVDSPALVYALVEPPAHGTLGGTPPALTYVPAPDFAGADSFTFVASDGDATSDVATFTLVVAPVNDPPVVAPLAAATDEDVAVAVTLTATDVDSGALAFEVVDPPAHGTLGGVPPALTYVPAPDWNGSDTFSFRASDGVATSALALATVTVRPVNDAPTVAGASLATDEDVALGFSLATSDVDADPLTYVLVSAPALGAVTAAGATLTYTPAPNAAGLDTFEVAVTDGVATSAAATVAVEVRPVNDAPVAFAQAVGTLGVAPIDVVLTGVDVDGDALTFAVVDAPAHGALAGTPPLLTYTAFASFTGADTFTFRADDGQLASAPATVTVSVSVSNDAPVASDAAVSTDEDVSLAVTLAATDADGDALTYSVVTGPAHGTLSGAAPALVYKPAADYHGADSFTFVADDGQATSAIATVTLTVSAVNDAPVAEDGVATVAEDGSVALVLDGGDVDGDALVFVVTSPPAYGTLSGTPPALTYAPAPDFAGADALEFTVSDGVVTSPPARLALTVTPVNDAPVALDAQLAVAEDGAAAARLSASDPDGEALAYVLVTPPAHGTLSGTPPDVVYTPVANYHGPDAFTWRADDGAASSNTATVEVTVSPVNDAPSASPAAATVAEDGARALVLSGTDLDGDALTFSILTPPTHGTLSGVPPSVTYTPAPDYAGLDTFAFVVSDGAATSAPSTVSLTVTAVNDPPVAVSGGAATLEDAPVAVTLSATDVDSANLTYAIVSGPANGTLTGVPPMLTYVPALDFSGGDSFTFRASDGEASSALATVTLTVLPVNDAPVAQARAVTLAQDSASAITLTATDVDGDALTYRVVSGPAHGTLSGTAPALTFTAAAGYSGADAFTFVASDGAADSAPATVSLTVTVALPPGLVAAYGFEEGAGVAVGDRSGLGNHGAQASATWTAAGRFGNALLFNGTSSMVTVPDAPSLRLRARFTLMAWVRAATVASTWRTILLKERTGGLAYALYATNGANKPPAVYVSDGVDVASVAPTKLALNAWTHVAGTFDGTALRMYVNGTLVKTVTNTRLPVASTAPLQIGANTIWGERFSGTLDEIRLFDRALSAAELTTLMNTPVGP